MKLRKIPKFYLKLKIINFGIIRKHINDFFDRSSKDRIYIWPSWDKVCALPVYIVYQLNNHISIWLKMSVKIKFIGSNTSKLDWKSHI